MIDAINLGQRQALTTTQEIIPITLMLDSDGEDTEDPALAVCFVAGPMASGDFITDECQHYDWHTPSPSIH